MINISFNKPNFQYVPAWASIVQIVSCFLLIEEEVTRRYGRYST